MANSTPIVGCSVFGVDLVTNLAVNTRRESVRTCRGQKKNELKTGFSYCLVILVLPTPLSPSNTTAGKGVSEVEGDRELTFVGNHLLVTHFLLVRII